MTSRVYILCIAAIMIFGCAVDMLSQSPPGCTVSNVNPSHDTVVNAISAAHDGDVICLGSTIGQGGSGGVPLDYVEWTSGINVTSGGGVAGTIAVEIRGAGTFNSTCLQYDNVTPASTISGGCGSAGQTKIYLHNAVAGNGFGWFTTSSTKNITISNMTFLKDINTPASPSSGDSGFILAGQPGTGKIAPFILHHNDFITDCFIKAFMILVDSNQGVMYRNRFMNNGTQTGGGGNLICNGTQAFNHADGGNGNATWSSNSTFGTADTDGTNNLYIENNYFRNFAALNDLHDGGAREVFRFNEVHNGNLTSHGWDSTGTGGGRGIEVYGNDFFCDEFAIMNATYITQRTGTGFYHSNIFHSFPLSSSCTPTPATETPIFLNQAGAEECNSGAQGWPGQSRNHDATHNSYPIVHQVGWGYNSVTSPSNDKIGTSPGYAGPSMSPQIRRTDQPGAATPGWAWPPGDLDGDQQSLEPMYMMNNNNMANTPVTAVRSGATNCRAEAWSAYSKANSQTLTIPDTANGAAADTYANSGEQAVMTFADLIGSGTITPTITVNGSNSCGTITALSSQTSGSMRLQAWTCTVNTDGPQTVVFTSSAAASTAARAGTVLFLRGLLGSALPFNTNPAVASVTTSPYSANAGTNYTSMNTIVIGYFALPVPGTDNLQPGSSDLLPMQCGAQCTPISFPSGGWQSASAGPTIGVDGTTGGSDVSVAMTYRVVNSTTAIQTQESDSTGCGGCTVLAGSVSFTVNGSTANFATAKTVLDMDSSDFIAKDKEFYDDYGPNSGTPTFNGTSGTGAGTAASIPNGAGGACTNGVGYYATDLGSWNTLGGNQGVLFKCGFNATSGHWPASLTTGNAFYTPYVYPWCGNNGNPACVDGTGGNSQSFSQQPTNTVTGHAFSPQIKITLTSSTADSITLSVTTGTCSFTGTNPVTSTGGSPNTATFSLTANATGVGCVLTSHDNRDGTVSDIMSTPFNVVSAGGGKGAFTFKD